MLQQTVGFLGAGQMATALAGGFVRAGLVAADRVVAHDPFEAARSRFVEALPAARMLSSNAEVAEASQIIILAVKPQQVAAVGQQLAGRMGQASDKLLVSIAAGVTLAQLREHFGTDRLVRVMPNTPCLVGQGAAGYALGPRARPEDGQQVEQLLSAVGLALQVDEPLLDVVTGLSGSGPAFVYAMIEALSDGGVRMGLPRSVATRLAAHTVRGAASMVIETGEHPAVLKDRVTSPAGTTIAGLQALEDRGFRGALMAAVVAATQRSVELGED